MHPTQLFQALGVPPLPPSNPYGAPSYPSLQQLANPALLHTPHNNVPALIDPSRDANCVDVKPAKESRRPRETRRLLHPSTYRRLSLCSTYSSVEQGPLEFYDAHAPYYEYVLVVSKLNSHSMPIPQIQQSLPTSDNCARAMLSNRRALCVCFLYLSFI